MNINLKDIDRTIFERLRLAVVKEGLYPDITKYTTRASFEKAKDDLRTSGVELVEPVGVGSWPSKDERTISKIVLIRRRLNTGGLVGHGCTFYKGMYKIVDGVETVIGGKELYRDSYNDLYYDMKGYIEDNNEYYLRDAYYKQFAYPANQKSAEYDIRILCNTAVMERRLLKLVSDCMGQGKLVTGLVDDNGVFGDRTITIMSQGAVNVTSGRIIEWSVTCETEALWLDEPMLVRDKIPLLRKVTGNVVLTPDVHRPHAFGPNGEYLKQEDEVLVSFSEKNL